MSRIEIKYAPQDNGLWGSPPTLKSITSLITLPDEKQKLFSAICAGIYSIYPDSDFSVTFPTEEGFVISFLNGEGLRRFPVGMKSVKYSYYKIEGNSLIWVGPKN